MLHFWMFMKGFAVSVLARNILTAVLWNIYKRKKQCYSILYTCLRYLSISVEELYTSTWKFVNTTEVQILTSWEFVWNITSVYAFLHYKTKHLHCPCTFL